MYGVIAIAASIGFLVLLLGSIITKGLPAFTQTFVKLDIELTAEQLGVGESPSAADLRAADYNGVIRQNLRELFPDVSGRKDRRALYELISTGAEYQLYDEVAANPELINSTFSLWVPADDELGAIIKNREDLDDPDSIITRMSDQQIGWAKQLQDNGQLDVRFNSTFFENGDSREPELAGIRGGGAIYCIWLAWPGSIHQFLPPATLGTGRGWHCIKPDDPAYNHHLQQGCA